ncbi:unnamed protein product [Diamesa serratosioi]
MTDILEPPIKNFNDKKEYRLLKLPNGLTVLLIKNEDIVRQGESDETKQNIAALALDINVGAFEDPKEIKGLSHFLEHMVFMGSEKYPIENDFNQYITEHAGSSNAMTSQKNTTFFFTIVEESFEGAMDRLAQFFISPLMLENSVDREIQAVESEFQNRINNDYVRTNQIMISMAHESHRASSFTPGNFTTLRDNIKSEDLFIALHKHRAKYYVSNRMNLCMQSNIELDIQQSLVEKYFSDIKSGEGVAVVDDNEYLNVFKPEFHQKMFIMKPKQEGNDLELKWITPSLYKYYKCDPGSYLSTIFGYEGPGSLASYLKKKSLAIQTVAGPSSGLGDNEMFSLFEIIVTLTDHGLQNIDEVIEAIFSFILLCQNTSMSEHKRIYTGIQQIKNINYKYRTENSEITNVKNLVQKMKLYPAADLMRAGNIFIEFDEDVILKFIQMLTIDNMNILLSTKTYDHYDQKEKWFGTEYTTIDFPNKYIESWNEKKYNNEFSLPPTNEFICTDFDIYDKETPTVSSEHPEKVFHNDICDVWYKLDGKFNRPLGIVKISLISPKHKFSNFNATLTELYMMFLDRYTYEYFYPAEEAGFQFDVSTDKNGLQLNFTGFNEKLEMLIDSVTKLMTNCNTLMEEVFFQDLKKAFKTKCYGNLISSGSLSPDYMQDILRSDHVTDYELYKEIDKIKFEDLERYSEKIFTQLKIKILVQGNLTKDQALSIGQVVLQNLSPGQVTDASKIESRCRKIEVGNKSIKIKSFLPNDKNSNTLCYYEIGKKNIRLDCLLELLQKVISDPLYDNLRTKEQLGYSVGSAKINTYGILGMVFVLLSQENKHSADVVKVRIEKFVTEDLKKLLEEMSSEQFNTIKDSTVKINYIDDVQLGTEVNRNWNQIITEEHMFNYRSMKAKTLTTITKDELLEFYNSGIFTRKLSIQIIGNATDQLQTSDTEELTLNLITDNTDDITDIDDFKNGLFVYPVLKVQI